MRRIFEMSTLLGTVVAVGIVSLLLLRHGVYEFIEGPVAIIVTLFVGYSVLSKIKRDSNGGKRCRRTLASTMKIIQKIEDTFAVSCEHGFIIEDPAEKLPNEYNEYETLARDLVSLLERRQLRQRVLQLTVDVDRLDINKLSKKELLLAHLVLSLITMGYVWQDGETGVEMARTHLFNKRLPRSVSVPLCKVSDKLGLKPIASYSSTILGNWKMTGDRRNLEPIYSTPGGKAASWFILIHTCVEKKFSPAIKLVCLAMIYAEDEDIQSLTETLEKIPAIFQEMITQFRRIKEHLEPVDFYKNIRLFLVGWDSKSKVLPQGLIYEGINNDEPIQLIGASGAQSATLQVMDAALGVEHEGEQRKYMETVRDYMLKEHHQFIDYIHQRSLIRQVVLESDDSVLTAAYNRCIRTIVNYRKFHCEWIVMQYIIKQQGTDVNKLLRGRGTGSTVLGEFLNEAIRTTKKAELGPS